MGMTKKDREEFSLRMLELGKKDYWRHLSLRQSLEYGLTNKRQILNQLREEGLTHE